MRHLYKYICLTLLVVPLLISACHREQSLGISDQPGLVRFTLSTSDALRASGDESQISKTIALDREKAIDKLYAVIYRTSSGLHHKTVACHRVGSSGNQYEFDNERSGDYYFFLIANPDSQLESALQSGPTTPDDLGKLIAHQDPGADASATHFLMVSDRVNVQVLSKQATTLRESLPLRRLAARFDFYNKVKGLEITKITFNKRYVASHLFAQVNKMDELSATSDKVYTGTPLLVDKPLLGTVYGYETDLRGEVSFTLEGTYDGEPISPEVVRLENFVIKRNHLYKVVLNSGDEMIDPKKPFGSLKYDIIVSDWSDEGEMSLTGSDLQSVLDVRYAAELAHASYVNPQYADSPEVIYTNTYKATSILFKVKSHGLPGSVELPLDYQQAGVTISEEGTTTQDPTDQSLTRCYRLHLPERPDFVSISHFKRDGQVDLEQSKFFDIPLIIKNGSGDTVKRCTVHHGRLKMPLEHLSQTPLNKAGDDFSTTPNDMTTIGLFTQKYEAKPRFNVCTIQGTKYHLPQGALELLSIIPPGVGEDGDTPLVGEKAIPKQTIKMPFIFPAWYTFGTSISTHKAQASSSFQTDPSNKRVSYALCFRDETALGFGNLLTIAYRFESVGDFKKAQSVSSYFKITCRYIGLWDMSLEDIATEEFWQRNNSDDASRTIYALGYHYGRNRRPLDVNENIYLITAKTEDHKDDYTGREVKDMYISCADLSKGSWISTRFMAGNLYTSETSDAFPIWLLSNE